jgi:hypothetical protein
MVVPTPEAVRLVGVVGAVAAFRFAGAVARPVESVTVTLTVEGTGTGPKKYRAILDLAMSFAKVKFPAKKTVPLEVTARARHASFKSGLMNVLSSVPSALRRAA